MGGWVGGWGLLPIAECRPASRCLLLCCSRSRIVEVEVEPLFSPSLLCSLHCLPLGLSRPIESPVPSGCLAAFLVVVGLGAALHFPLLNLVDSFWTLPIVFF